MSADGGSTTCLISKSSDTYRSVSRGRETLTSVGRGGAGNFQRSESVSRERVVHGFPGEERGRELPLDHPLRLTHSGRGGAGNIRSPSRDPSKIEREIEQDLNVVHEHNGSPSLRSTGRGGAGNMRTLSMSPSRPSGASGASGEDVNEWRGRPSAEKIIE